ncbi:MAG: glycosyltransferase [Acidimicrobiales bacterium]
MRSLAVLSLHTSPLAQPGTGDGGGMNVYVRELSAALARTGVECDVYTRAWSEDAPAVVAVEPGLRVHHIPAGPLAPVRKEALPEVVEEFTEGVLARLHAMAAGRCPGGERPLPDAVHANYWLSGLAGHVIKHELELPLVSTFHTLDRVKADASPEEVVASEPARRAEAEAAVIDCSDAVLASCSVEADQIVALYGADPSRIEIVAPGVDHAFFAPGDRAQARRALGLGPSGGPGGGPGSVGQGGPGSVAPGGAGGPGGGGPMLGFVGRIQPLKGADVAVRSLDALRRRGFPDAFLVVIGGPSGPQGEDELARLHALVEDLGLGQAVRFVPPQPHELLSTWYRAMDVCVVPSRSESFGLVALEAAACGTPVVASAVGGLSTLVADGRTGFLVDERHPGVFAERMAQVLVDPARARAMSGAAAVRAKGYTWSIAAARLRGLYERLTARQLVECR